MKEVEWWVVKVYPRSVIPKGEKRIDLWERFGTRREAERYVKNDGPDSSNRATGLSQIPIRSRNGVPCRK